MNPANGRLNLTTSSGVRGAWTPSSDDDHPWLQVDFLQATAVTKISTQGRHDREAWVESYRISWSNDGENFEFYKKEGQIKVGE